MRLRYDIVDVFTDRPFAGNQLAVVHGAGELSTDQCLALAREFNYSETTFPVPVSAVEYAVRIFTPGSEIPFAGHPTLGTAWVLRSHDLLSGSLMTQQCGAGAIEVRFDGDLVSLAATPRDLVGPVDDEIADALLAEVGLEGADLDGPVWVAGAGLTFAHVPVRAEALPHARAARRPLAEVTGGVPTSDPFEGINVYATTGSGRTLAVRSRVFVPGLSLVEDPATGSAAAGLGMALVARGLLRDGGRYEITQGVEMGRSSSLHGRVEVDAAPTPDSGGVATLCHVAGTVHPVASGEIAVPPA